MEQKHILVVEDESIVALDIRRSLENLGYVIPAVVASGEEAIKKAEEFHPDLVLMDIVLLGEMDGIEAAGHIRSNFHIPVVYLTAYSDEKILQRAKITEPFGYIIKPFKERELHINIEIALYKHNMEKELRESKEWYSTTLKSIGDAVIATDIDNNVIFMNHIAESLTGWKMDEAKGKSLSDVFNVITEDATGKTGSPVNEVLEEGVIITQSNKTMLVAKDEIRTSIEDSGDPIKDEKGNIKGSVLIFRDISERIEAEEESIRIIDFYENILNGVIYGLMATDKDDIINYANEKIQEIIGPDQNIIGVRILKDFQQGTMDVLKPYYLKAKESLEPARYDEVPFISGEGERTSRSGWFVPIIENGSYNGIIWTVEG